MLRVMLRFCAPSVRDLLKFKQDDDGDPNLDRNGF